MNKYEIDVISAAITFVSKAERHREISDENLIDFSELKDAVDAYRLHVEQQVKQRNDQDEIRALMDPDGTRS